MSTRVQGNSFHVQAKRYFILLSLGMQVFGFGMLRYMGRIVQLLRLL